MQGFDEFYWKTDDDLSLALDGAKAVADWFGYVPSFHDATIDKVELGDGSAQLTLRSFRMTDELDGQGYFVLDRHALITMHFDGVTGLSLIVDAKASISELALDGLRLSKWVGKPSLVLSSAILKRDGPAM